MNLSLNTSPQVPVEYFENLTRRQKWYVVEPQIREICTTALGIDLWEKQNAILNDHHPYKVIKSGRFFSKTWLMSFRAYQITVFGAIYNYPITMMFGADDCEATKYVWKHYINFLEQGPINGILNAFGLPKRANYKTNYYSPSTYKKYVEFPDFGGKVETAGLQDTQASDFRGPRLDFGCLEEAGNIRNLKAGVDALEGCLIGEPLGEMMVVGTMPPGVQTYFQLIFDKGQHPDKLWKSWQGSTLDNPYHDRQRLENILASGDDDKIRREVYGDYVPVGGQLFPMFNRNRHVVKDLLKTYNPNQDLIVGWDPGFNSSCIEFFQVDNPDSSHPKVRVLYEKYIENSLITEVIPEVKDVVDKIFHGRMPLVVGLDKAGNQKGDKVSWTTLQKIKETFPSATCSTDPFFVNKTPQTEMIRGLLGRGDIQIDENCPRLITGLVEAEPDGRMVNGYMILNSGGHKKQKNQDHPIDALEYGLINYGPTSKLMKPEEEIGASQETINRLNRLYFG